MKQRHISVEKQSWPLQNEFRISRGARTSTEVVQVIIKENNIHGWAESVPYGRYQETLDSVIEQIESVTEKISHGMTISELNELLPAGAARNALDCALWDLEAKKQHRAVHELIGVQPFTGTLTAQTLSIDSPEKMAAAATLLYKYPLIKVKLDQHLVMERMQSVADAAPNSQFIIDANEAWNIAELKDYADKLAALNVVLIEQPLSAAHDADLINYQSPVPLCADESIHTINDLQTVAQSYQAINIKLDKTGGLTEALKLLHQAREQSLLVMVGCMVGTSLAMAPATLLTGFADFVDLDGPSLLAKDKAHGFTYHNGMMSALNPDLWGGPGY